jgi:NAD(P)-dependent dehydrogenase (short-subunit alcohol dehydrogenase family)
MPTILIAGASRGLGLAIAGEFATRGWTVIGTVRSKARTGLHELADAHPDTVEIAMLDIDDPDQIATLHRHLSGRALDILFINAGVAGEDRNAPIGTLTQEEFARVMTTNVLSPMRVIEALQDLVPADGLIGAMLSGQGSIANNQNGVGDLYRASKAALNMVMQGYAARAQEPPRAMLLLAPGWIRTALGGDKAPFGIEESAPILAELLITKRGRPGLEYLDRFGDSVPW